MQSSGPLPFAIDLSAEIPRFRAETFWSKEPETLEWINRNLDNKSNVDLFIDVGANIGIYSLYASVVNQGVSIILSRYGHPVAEIKPLCSRERCIPHTHLSHVRIHGDPTKPTAEEWDNV